MTGPGQSDVCMFISELIAVMANITLHLLMVVI